MKKRILYCLLVLLLLVVLDVPILPFWRLLAGSIIIGYLSKGFLK